MPFLFYHLISWSESSKIASSWNAQTHHSVRWTLPHKSFWYGCHSRTNSALRNSCHFPALCNCCAQGIGDIRLGRLVRHTLPAPCCMQLTPPDLQPHWTDMAEFVEEKKTHLLGSCCKVIPTQRIKQDSHCPLATAVSIARVLAAACPIEWREAQITYFV